MCTSLHGDRRSSEYPSDFSEIPCLELALEEMILLRETADSGFRKGNKASQEENLRMKEGVVAAISWGKEGCQRDALDDHKEKFSRVASTRTIHLRLTRPRHSLVADRLKAPHAPITL